MNNINLGRNLFQHDFQYDFMLETAQARKPRAFIGVTGTTFEVVLYHSDGTSERHAGLSWSEADAMRRSCL